MEESLKIHLLKTFFFMISPLPGHHNKMELYKLERKNRSLQEITKTMINEKKCSNSL